MPQKRSAGKQKSKAKTVASERFVVVAEAETPEQQQLQMNAEMSANQLIKTYMIDTKTYGGFRLVFQHLETVYGTGTKHNDERDSMELLKSTDYLKAMWNVYNSLCAYCQCVPIYQEYLEFVGMTKPMARRIKESGGEIAKYLDVVQDGCENGMLRRAVDSGSIGSMFALKAQYGYRDSGPKTVINVATQHASVSELMDKYGSGSLPPPEDDEGK